MRGGRKNTISLGLVYVPVKLPSATDGTRELKTELIAPSGAKAKQVYLDETTGAIIENRDELRRGVKRGDGYAIIPDEAWEAICEATKLPAAEIQGFIDPAELDARRDRVRDTHYVQPEAGAARALALVAKAMEASGKAAVLTFQVGSRQRLGVLRVRDDGGLELLTLRPECEVRLPDEEVLALNQVEVDEKAPEFGHALSLIEAMETDGSVLDEWRPEDVERRNALIEQALTDGRVEVEAAPEVPAGGDDDLMAKLEESAEQIRREKKKPKRKAKTKATA